MKYRNLIFSLLVISMAGYIIIAVLGDFRTQIEWFLLIISLIFSGYFCLIYFSTSERSYDKYSLIMMFVAGLVFRMILIPGEPVLSEDVYRYFWDGRVSAAGINPYRFAPDDPALAFLHDQELPQKINFPGIPTVYPPVAQGWFLINTWLGGGLITWKIILLITELILIWCLWRLLHHFQIPQIRMGIFWFNPLVIIETYHSGHFELVGVMWFWLAIYLFYQRRPYSGVVLFSFSALSKFLPLLTALPFFSRKFFKYWPLYTGIIAVIILVFTSGGVLPVGGLFSYVNRWEFNGFIYQSVSKLIGLFIEKDIALWQFKLGSGTEIIYLTGALLYKVLAGIAVILIFWDQMNKLRATSRFNTITYIKTAYILTAAVLLLTPTLYPWYLIWIIPFLLFFPNWSWLVLTALIQFSYFILKNYSSSGVWEESTWILILQYVPFFALLLWEYMDNRRIKGWLF